MYFSFGLDGEYVGIGAWHMDAPVLQRYRCWLTMPGLALSCRRS